MSSPEISAEILEGFKSKVARELLRIHGELDNIGVFIPDTLTDEKCEAIHMAIGALEKEAETMAQGALAEILTRLELQFHSLRTVGVVDNLERFQVDAAHANDNLEIALLMIPSTSEAVLKSIKERRSRF